MLMLIKSMETMPKLKELDFSFVVVGPNQKMNVTKQNKK